MNSIGKNLRLTTFGESHGPAIGGILDGMPPRVQLDYDRILRAMAERRPGNMGGSARREEDAPEILSGISKEGLTLGTPIGFIIRNKDVRSGDYEEWADVWRPNHADYAYECRYGIREFRGGGRASARETACRVAAAAIVEQWLDTQGVTAGAVLASAGKVKCEDLQLMLAHGASPQEVSIAADAKKKEMLAEIEEARAAGDSVGGSVVGWIQGVRPGVGNPVYGKIQMRLAEAMMSINAAKSFEYGLGESLSKMKGSEAADEMRAEFHASGSEEFDVKFKSNCSGGLQGGISTGQLIYFKVGFKPTPSISLPLTTIRSNGESVEHSTPGRHDPCVALRAVSVVKAMAILTIADFIL